MLNEKVRTRLGQRLALGVALLNGATTLAPVALLYAQPGQAEAAS